LESDLRSLESLRAESSIFDFAGSASEPVGAVDTYIVRFRGPSFYRSVDRYEIGIGREHEVLIRLGAAYPRQAPALAWRTPIFHPNISTSGAVCLGGYSTFWVPSLHLDQLCDMLWDMIRLQNFDVKSPYNREAAGWLASQRGLQLPLDERPLRDLARDVVAIDAVETSRTSTAPPVVLQRRESPGDQGIEIIDAEVVFVAQSDILFIE